MPDNGYQTAVHGVPGGAYLVLGTDENGLPCILTAGAATSDATIVAAIGADTLWADGSIYVSVVDAAGVLFLKTNDVWIDQK